MLALDGPYIYSEMLKMFCQVNMTQRPQLVYNIQCQKCNLWVKKPMGILIKYKIELSKYEFIKNKLIFVEMFTPRSEGKL